MAARTLSRLNTKSSALLLCDMQEKFRNTIQHFLPIVSVSNRMLKAAKILDVPVVATEQYPKGKFFLEGWRGASLERSAFRFGSHGSRAGSERTQRANLHKNLLLHDFRSSSRSFETIDAFGQIDHFMRYRDASVHLSNDDGPFGTWIRRPFGCGCHLVQEPSGQVRSIVDHKKLRNRFFCTISECSLCVIWRSKALILRPANASFSLCCAMRLIRNSKRSRN